MRQRATSSASYWPWSAMMPLQRLRRRTCWPPPRLLKATIPVGAAGCFPVEAAGCSPIGALGCPAPGPMGVVGVPGIPEDPGRAIPAPILIPEPEPGVPGVPADDPGRAIPAPTLILEPDTAANACVLALDPSEKKAALFSGSSKLTLTGCNVMANSVSTDGLYVQGAANLTAPCLMSSGGAVLTANVTLTTCKTAMTNLRRRRIPSRHSPSPLVPASAAVQPAQRCNRVSIAVGSA